MQMISWFMISLFFSNNFYASYDTISSIDLSSYVNNGLHQGHIFDLISYDFKKNLIAFFDKDIKTKNNLRLVNTAMCSLVDQEEEKILYENYTKFVSQHKKGELIDALLVPKAFLKIKDLSRKLREDFNILYEYDCVSNGAPFGNMYYFSVAKELIIHNADIETLSNKKIRKLLRNIGLPRQSRKDLQHIVFQSAKKLKNIDLRDFNYRISIKDAPKLKLNPEDLTIISRFCFVNLSQLPFEVFNYDSKMFIEKQFDFTGRQRDDLLKELKRCLKFGADPCEILDILLKNRWFYFLFDDEKDCENFFLSSVVFSSKDFAFFVPLFVICCLVVYTILIDGSHLNISIDVKN